MTQLIDKSALAAEIERRIKKYASVDVRDNKELDTLYGAKCHALTSILSFLDTLEVKEVDLEKEIQDHIRVGTNIEWIDMDTLESHCYNCCLFDNGCKDISLCKRPTNTYKGFYKEKK